MATPVVSETKAASLGKTPPGPRGGMLLGSVRDFRRDSVGFLEDVARRHGNVTRYRPERFSPEHPEERPRYAYFPFGGGPRQCIGKDMALVEARLILATVAGRYRLRLVHDQPMEPEALATLRPRGGLPMIPGIA